MTLEQNINVNNYVDVDAAGNVGITLSSYEIDVSD